MRTALFLASQLGADLPSSGPALLCSPTGPAGSFVELRSLVWWLETSWGIPVPPPHPRGLDATGKFCCSSMEENLMFVTN